jgi:hypothetical protein
MVRLNASRGLEGRINSQRATYGAAMAGKEYRIKQRSEMHIKERLKQENRLENGLVSPTEYSLALEAKECMFEIQGIMLGKLAREENSLNDLSNISKMTMADFQSLIKEVEDALGMLRM